MEGAQDALKRKNVKTLKRLQVRHSTSWNEI
jgi:hypothetical protein